jgi:large subunit ribosomal protein L29
VKASELRELTLDELATKARETRNEYFGARVRFATGQLENTAKLRLLRRDVARIETVLRQRSGDADTSEKGGAIR